MNITIRTTTRTDDKTGREITRFTPYLTLRPWGTGEISLAVWEAWTDNRAEVEQQWKNAEREATETIRTIAAQLVQLADSREYPETDPVTLAMSRQLDAALAAGAAIQAANQK